MLKIGLMTWHTYENYGTFLQWYALTKVMVDLGLDVTSIDYIPRRTPPESIHPSKISSLFIYYKNRIINRITKGKLILPFDITEKHALFQEFKEQSIFKFTNKCETASELFALNKDFDYFVCGSDQIWSPLCFDPHYFLDFVDDRNKKIAYAPSLGVNRINNELIKKNMSYLIEQFKYLSVREDAGREIIKDICKVDIPVVLDPTLLLSVDDWNDIANDEYKISEKYILCYFLGNKKRYWKDVVTLAQKEKLKLVILPVYKRDYKRTGDILRDVGPKEFLSLIKNATFICTDSYHCSIFSFLYQKNFALYKRFNKNERLNQNSRIDCFVTKFSLKNKVVSNSNTLKKIYYDISSYSFNDLFDEKSKSMNYLKKTIFTEKEKKEIPFKITNTCCGCGVCATVCHTNAIDIKRDRDGFLQSFVNDEKCTRCNSCRNICPFYKKKSIQLITKENKLYAVKSKNLATLSKSSSGGIGFELMNLYRENNLSVSACVYDPKIQEAKVICVNSNNDNSIDDISIFQGSKYIQSNYTSIYNELKHLNTGGIIVGLPCQIAGIHNYLLRNRRRDDFLLVDVICHGVPSQVLWNKYINEKKRQYSFDDIVNVIFRDKRFGWARMFITLRSSNKEVSISCKNDLFYSFFLAGNCYAPSCYECNYRNCSCADLRIADYWGPNFKKDKTGVSMCIPLTKKGEEKLNILKNEEKVSCDLGSIDDVFKYQQTVNTFKPVEYNDVLEALKSDESLKVIKRKFLSTYHFKEKIISPLYPCISRLKEIFIKK